MLNFITITTINAFIPINANIVKIRRIQREKQKTIIGKSVVASHIDCNLLKTKPNLNTQLDIINYLSFHAYIISLLHLASMLNSSLFVHAYYLTFTYHLCYPFYHFHFSLSLEPFMF